MLEKQCFETRRIRVYSPIRILIFNNPDPDPSVSFALKKDQEKFTPSYQSLKIKYIISTSVSGPDSGAFWIRITQDSPNPDPGA